MKIRITSIRFRKSGRNSTIFKPFEIDTTALPYVTSPDEPESIIKAMLDMAYREVSLLGVKADYVTGIELRITQRPKDKTDY